MHRAIGLRRDVDGQDLSVSDLVEDAGQVQGAPAG